MFQYPHRVVMTLDAVGGVWRYAIDLAQALRARGDQIFFAGFGPEPSPGQIAEARAFATLTWHDCPLDWMVRNPADLTDMADCIRRMARENGASLIHLNSAIPAAIVNTSLPVIVAMHSCLETWFQAVRRSSPPDYWRWQHDYTRAGLAGASAVVAPTAAYAGQIEAAYGPIPHMQVVPNGTDAADWPAGSKEPIIFSAARWWDEGKNGAVLDATAAAATWPIIAAGATTGPDGQSFTFSHARTTGSLPTAEVDRQMKRAAIYMSPSLYEPFGLGVLEAARRGAALVLSDIPTYRELWDGAAVFAPPASPSAFARLVNRLAEDDGVRRELAERAAKRSHDYTVARQAAAISALYDDTLNRRSRPAASA